MNLDKVKVKFMPGSGCYGHNGADDVAFEVAVLSKEFPDKHILLKWTREDEHCWEPYGSASLNKLKGVIDNYGKIIYWSNEAYSDTYMTRPSNTELHNFISYDFMKNNFVTRKSTPKTKAHMGIHRNLDPLYNFGEKRLVKNLVHDLPLRTSALRTLGAFSNVVASESFINELADIKKIDPFEIRINHLRDERAINVIQNLKDQMLKQEIIGENKRGIGFSRYKNSAAYCAVGVELKVSDDLEIKLINAWITVDAGEVAYEDGIIAQVEGGFIQAASWALYEEVLFDVKEITSKDWDTYKIIEFDNIPTFQTNVIDKNKVILKIDSLDMTIFSKRGEKIYSITSPNSSYDNVELKFELKKPIINILNGEEIKYIISSEESSLSDNNKLLKLNGNVKLKTLKKDGDFLYADNFIWNIENTNYLLEGNIRFENQNIILNSGKAILGSDNIIEFFNPVKYIIKDENKKNKYEINSENAFYNLNTESVSFEAKDKRVKSIIYF